MQVHLDWLRRGIGPLIQGTWTAHVPTLYRRSSAVARSGGARRYASHGRAAALPLALAVPVGPGSPELCKLLRDKRGLRPGSALPLPGVPLIRRVDRARVNPGKTPVRGPHGETATRPEPAPAGVPAPATNAAASTSVDSWLVPLDNRPQRVADKRRQPMRLSALFDEFLTFLRVEKEAAPRSIETYRWCFGDFVAFAPQDVGGTVLVTHFTADRCREYQYALSARGLQTNSIRVRLATLGSFGKWAVRREKLDKNPLDLLTRPRRKARLPRVPKWDTVKQLLAESSDPRGPHGLRGPQAVRDRCP